MKTGIDAFEHFKRISNEPGAYEIKCAFCSHKMAQTTVGKSVVGVAAKVKAAMRKHVHKSHRQCSACGDFGHNAKSCKGKELPSAAIASVGA